MSNLFVITYTYADGSQQARGEHGPAHVAFLRELHEAGTVKLAGPFDPDDISGGMVILAAETTAEVYRRLDDDPFWKIGAISDRTVQPFAVVIGALA